MIKPKLTYPILVFKKGDNNLYAGKDRLDIYSKGGGKFFKGKILVVDSDGYSHRLLKSSVKGKASFFESLKHLQPMYEMILEFETEPQTISLEELKIKAMNQVKKKPKFWLSLDTIEGIQEMVDNAKTYKELILIFR